MKLPSRLLPLLLLAAGDVLYFSATDAVGGREPWRTDGSEAGGALVEPRHLVVSGQQVFFTAEDEGGSALWAFEAVSTPVAVGNINGP